jgi:hypothetical protein
MPLAWPSAGPFSAVLEHVSYSARPEPAGDGGDNRKQNFTTANTRKSVLRNSKQWAKPVLAKGTGPALSY